MTAIKSTVAALFAALLLAGCNTIGGLGQDVEEGGSALQDTAQDAEQEIEN